MKTLIFANETIKRAKNAINASIFEGLFANCRKNVDTYRGVIYLKVQTMKSPNPGKREAEKKSLPEKETEAQIVRKDSPMSRSLKMFLGATPRGKKGKAPKALRGGSSSPAEN